MSDSTILYDAQEIYRAVTEVNWRQDLYKECNHATMCTLYTKLLTEEYEYGHLQTKSTIS